MSESIEKNLSAAAGEYLVLGELLKRSNMAFLAQGPTQRGWDIIIVDKCNRQFKKIQVKAIDWPCSKNNAINLTTPFEFDYLVIVLLQRNKQRSRFFILTKEDAKQYLSKKNNKRKDKKQTITISNKNLKDLGKKEDNWKILT